MLMGIEIGGTKLQVAVGRGDGGDFEASEHRAVDPNEGAEGILATLREVVGSLRKRHDVRCVGIGFGGPVLAAEGRVICSHQIAGWDDFPLVSWCEETWGLPAVLENDSNLAGLGEARFGAGRDEHVVVYSNVGSGIGGALVLDGKLYTGGSGRAVVEIGHLRPGLFATEPGQTVESLASGWALAERAKKHVEGAELPRDRAARDLVARCNDDLNQLTGKIVVEASADGNALARDIVDQAVEVYGWALAQVITLLSPNVVVIGGGVAQSPEALFLEPLRRQTEQYVMPPLRGTYRIVAAELGEAVVVHGALALAATYSS